jgi:hypothetical protein
MTLSAFPSEPSTLNFARVSSRANGAVFRGKLVMTGRIPPPRNYFCTSFVATLSVRRRIGERRFCRRSPKVFSSFALADSANREWAGSWKAILTTGNIK